jgi:hypothetical protein
VFLTYSVFFFKYFPAFASYSALSASAYDDAYLTILDVDGSKWRDKLRSRMAFYPNPNRDAIPLNEQTDLLLSV